MVTNATDKLIASIVTWIVAQDSFVTKTKLLKLLYLFDVEYYRVHRHTFTGFRWKFFHLGPWAPEFDPLLQGMVRIGALRERRSSNANTDSEACFYSTKVPVDTGAAFTKLGEEGLLRKVLIRWGEAPTGDILNHVYFQTAPMESAVRNQPLDFSVIPTEPPAVYSRSSSGKSPAEIQKLRRQFHKQQEHRAKQRLPFTFTQPRYDKEFHGAMSKLETA
jgi:hypothetical protein